MNEIATPKPTCPPDCREDHVGRFVPVGKIKPVDLYRDETVKTLVLRAKEAQENLVALKLAAKQTIDTFIGLSLSEWGVIQQSRASKGNLTLRSYDGKQMVKIAIGETFVFDEQLQAAKHLIDECFMEWVTTETDENLKVAVLNAFQVSKEGKIDIRRVLELRSYKIEHPKWKKAMDAITASLTVISSKAYIRFYEYDDKTEKLEHIALDMAAI